MLISTKTKIKLGVYLGTTAGTLGWLIGFSIICLTTGSMDILLQVLPPGLMMSLIMAGTFVFVAESVTYRFGYRHYMLQLSLWAILLSFMGMMMFILNHWLAPLIEKNPVLVSKLNSMGSVYRTSDLVPNILMAVGLILLLVVIISILRHCPTESTD